MNFATTGYEGKALGYQVLAVDGTVQSPTLPSGTRYAKVFFRGANVRMTMHGVDPTTSFGVPFYDGYEDVFSMIEMTNMRLTREGATNGEAHFVYFK